MDHQPLGQRPNYQTFGQSVVEKITTNSALNPLLWLCGVTLLFTMPGAIWGAATTSLVCLTLASAAVLAPIIAYFFWMFRDPVKLQSEHYQLERQKMELLGDERHRAPVIDGQLVENEQLQHFTNGVSK
ncbi:hypothetical protein ABIE88_000575 [Bradyrhizobium diazoefficiens]|uniref:hypothetical protein n=1 Tax=Bradyrhizobium diazoefficiens TaxID=1355477 RepID=UPI003517E714